MPNAVGCEDAEVVASGIDNGFSTSNSTVSETCRNTTWKSAREPLDAGTGKSLRPVYP